MLSLRQLKRMIAKADVTIEYPLSYVPLKAKRFRNGQLGFQGTSRLWVSEGNEFLITVKAVLIGSKRRR